MDCSHYNERQADIIYLLSEEYNTTYDVVLGEKKKKNLVRIKSLNPITKL